MGHIVICCVLSLLMPVATAVAAGKCESLELRAPVFSFDGHETRPFRRLLETIEGAGYPVSSVAVEAGFRDCLERALKGEERTADLEWLNRVNLEDEQVRIDGRLFEFARGKPPLWKAATSMNRRIVRQIADDDQIVTPLLWHAWVEALIESLDSPYNDYTYADEMDIDAGISRGRVFSVGFRVRRKDGRLRVDRIVDESLTEQHGISTGAIVELLDGRSVDEIDYRERVRYWYALKPFDYSARVETNTGKVDIAASAVPYRISTVSWTARGRVGYLRIDRFAAETLIELRRGLRELRDTDSLIIDLRSNGGGRVDTGLIDMFFKPHQSPASYRRAGEEGQPKHAEGSVEYHDQRLVVLIDRRTASMSELFAAAVRHHNRGILIGETTAGKGVSQTLYPIGEEGVLALVQTTYFFPGTETTWHEVGIEPHLQVDLNEDEREAASELVGAPVIDLNDRIEADPVLREALSLLEESP